MMNGSNGVTKNGRNGCETPHQHDLFTTRAIHVGSEPDPATGAVIPPLNVATTYRQHGFGKHLGFEYSRSNNPTRAALEAVLAELETCPESECSSCGYKNVSGGDSLVFASGSAATAAICYWAALQEGEGGARKEGEKTGHVLAINDVYGGTARFLTRAAVPTGIGVTFLDMEAAGEAGIRAAIRPDTKLVWLELPTNPLLLVPPLPLVAKIIDSMDSPKPLVVVDTTFLSPFYSTPLIANGPGAIPHADVVLTSLSKYGSGHSDVIAGALTLSARTIHHRPELLKALRFLQNSFGAVPSPRDCHLLSRSMKTLSLRMLRHGLNALRVAAWLKEHPKIEDVRYPGLVSSKAFHTVEPLLSLIARRELEYLGWEFPYKKTKPIQGSTIAETRTLGIPFGGVVSFKIRGADEESTERFATSLRLICLAESLGGVESLLDHPSSMTHAAIPEETRLALGITPNLVRFSVGLEDVEDLIGDLEHALNIF